jgi:hypothetical protein
MIVYIYIWLKKCRFFAGRWDRGDMLSLPGIIDRLGHEERVIDVFKIDCEGCE